MQEPDNTEYSPVLMLRLMRAVNWFDEHLRRSRTSRGLAVPPRAQSMLIINVLLGLNRPSQLADAMGTSRQAVSRLIADLVEAGILIAEKNPEDGRGTLVRVNPDSEAELRDTLQVISALEAQVAQIVGPDRMEVMRTVLAADWGEPELDALTPPED